MDLGLDTFAGVGNENAQGNLERDSTLTLYRADLLKRAPDLIPSYDRYLKNARIQISEQGAVVRVPSSFHRVGIERIRGQLEHLIGFKISKVEVDDSQSKQLPGDQNPSAFQLGLPLVPRQGPSTQSSFMVGPNGQNTSVKIPIPRPHIPYFISSPSFELGTELVRRWCQVVNTSNFAQVLWIHGKSGSGKTHLLRQFSSWISPQKRLVFCDVMTFLQEWRKSLELKDHLSFVRKFRKDVDVLVLENIEDLQNKHKTQEEVLFTLSAILERGCSVVVSSGVHPIQIREWIDPLLFSRIFSGQVVEMAAPDRAFKERLWKHMLEQYSVSSFPVDLIVLERLMNMPLDTARKVNTVFINAIGKLSLKRNLSIQDVMELESMHSVRSVDAQCKYNKPVELMEKVASLCGVGLSAIQGPVRRTDVSLARRFVCLALSKYLGLTNGTIATYVVKDASTISKTLKFIENEIESDRHINEQWSYICTQLGVYDAEAAKNQTRETSYFS